MTDLPQYWVKLHAEVHAGATGNNVGLFDIEATGKAAQTSRQPTSELSPPAQ
jgi:hypothetical protein